MSSRYTDSPRMRVRVYILHISGQYGFIIEYFREHFHEMGPDELRQ